MPCEQPEKKPPRPWATLLRATLPGQADNAVDRLVEHIAASALSQ